jgi:hypothetical protein
MQIGHKMHSPKYYQVVEDVDVDNELLEIIAEIFEYGRKHPKFKLDFAQKCRETIIEKDHLPMAMYNALVNIYYNFNMDK